MRGAVASWWQARTVRERRLLLIMFGLFAVVAVWLAILQPLADGLDRAQRRYQAAVEHIGEVRARSATVASFSRPGRPTQAGPLDAIVSRTATEAGFVGARVTNRGPSHAAITIDSARPLALFGWVRRLEQQGLVVESLRARANPDRTVVAEISFVRGR